ncbi:MAG TPA: RNA polymerase sigma-70 factor [Flavisolibacter sp.]|nr:RNA polymerase sigma-70 factor [Flavisolibacter sp.]
MRIPAEYSDAELLICLAKDDASAFRILFDRYNSKVYSIAYKFLKSSFLAEDVVQEVFTKLWIKKNELYQLRDFNAYLNTITRNHLLNQLKKLAHVEKFLLQQRNVTYENSVASVIELNELNYTIAKAMNRLPPQQKKVYHLGKVQGLSYEQIADQLQISKETVKTHMSEALRSIKAYLIRNDHTIANLIVAFVLSTKFFF